MTEQVDFYILGKVDRVAKMRYACVIAKKAYSQSMKVYLHTESPEQSEQLDKLLWTFSQDSFIPHTVANNATENWQHFPLQLGDTLDMDSNDTGDRADLLICLINDVPQAHTQFRRVVDLVIDTEKASGRARFRYYREQGIEPNTYIIEK